MMISYDDVLLLKQPKNVRKEKWEGMIKAYRVLWLVYNHKSRYDIGYRDAEYLVTKFRLKLGYVRVSNLKASLSRHFGVYLDDWYDLDAYEMREELIKIYEQIKNFKK